MNFSFPYYQFLFCHAPIHQVVRAMCLFLKKETTHWGKLRSGKYNQQLIDTTCYNNAFYYHPPTERMCFFVPNSAPSFTVGIITGHCTWECWLGSVDSTFEQLSIRFTTNDKSDSAIRELLVQRGLECLRIIRVMKDPKWDLLVEGEQPSFEEGKNYEKIRRKRIKDYFTQEDMIRFTSNWGCPFHKEEFWTSDQPMYVYGQLDDDDTLSDWLDESFVYWQEQNQCDRSQPFARL